VDSGLGSVNHVSFTDVAIVDNTGGNVGGLFNFGSNDTTLTDVTISGNQNTSDPYAAGVEDYGSLTLVNVTIANNVALGSGATGGIEGLGDTLTITNSDIVGNTGSDGSGNGGGLNDNGTVIVVNSIIADNLNNGAAGNTNCGSDAITTDGGYNIENGTTCGFTGTGDKNANPDLGALAHNGGPLETEALLTGSPAINAGLNASCPTDDERGYTRITASDPTCDIGAYEYGAGPVTTPTPSGVPVPTSGAIAAGTSSGSLWAVLLLIAGLGMAAAALRFRGRDPVG